MWPVPRSEPRKTNTGATYIVTPTSKHRQQQVAVTLSLVHFQILSLITDRKSEVGSDQVSVHGE